MKVNEVHAPTVRVVFSWSHPDRKPLGDMAATLQSLAVGNPEADFVYEYKKGSDVSMFDTRKVRQP
jgi:hypothetical protein